VIEILKKTRGKIASAVLEINRQKWQEIVSEQRHV